mmetsp:Transcript_35746/g.54723  ORF Transcript_35746/g.54723 Transcript_35746/m.54723 type:complete len:138 (-) Transcript_35746:1011-1424(-)
MDCSKFEKVRQLYDSKTLVDYPTQSTFHMVSDRDLLLIEELDAEDSSDLQVSDWIYLRKTENSIGQIQSLKASPGHADREKQAIRKNSSFEDLTGETEILRKNLPDQSDVLNVKIFNPVDIRNLIENHFDSNKPSEK